MDTEGQIIHYGERALVTTRYEKHVNIDKLPYGMNAIVAIISYKGYNINILIAFLSFVLPVANMF